MIGYVGVVDPSLEGNPSCHICGAVMVPAGELSGKIFKRTHWNCLSCGATTLATQLTEGKHSEFARARKEGTFPIDVYSI